MLPNFVIIGAMKAGTTALYGYLRRHDQVFMAEPKELDFFVSHWDQGLPWYEAHFREAGDAIAIGEASPNYTKRHDHPHTAQRMAEVIPNAKLIYMVRHPVDRMVSMYRHLVVDGLETRPIEQAFAENLDYINTSRYSFQLRPYLDLFGERRLLVIKSEDLKGETPTAMRRVFSFLEIDESSVPRIGRDANIGAERRQPKSWAQKLANVSPYRWLLSTSWRARMIHRRVGTRPAQEVPANLSTQTRRRLLAELDSDMSELSARFGISWS